MTNILLIIVLVIIIGSVILGIIKGFIKMLFTTAALVVTILIACALTTPVTNFVKDHTGIYNSIYEKMLDYTEDKIEDKFNDVEKAQAGAIEKLPIPSLLKDSLEKNNNTDTYKELGVTSFSDYIAAYIAIVILKALVFIILFIVIAVALGIICKILDLIARLPVIHQANKLLGGIFGLIQGLIIVWVIFVFITLLSATSLGQAAFSMINDSEILSILYNHNYLVKFITSILSMLKG